MMRSMLVCATVGATALLTACAAGSYGPEDATEPPGLSVGDMAPDVEVLTIEGEPVRLGSLYGDGPTVVTFYRGGWCPYCNTALSALQEKMPEFEAAGAQVIALTTEKPDLAQKTGEKNETSFRIFSDANLEASRRFRVIFELSPETRTKYKGYGIDLEQANASGTWELPAPATFVIDRDGVIRWVWADWDYTTRADPDKVLAGVRAIE